MPRHPVARQRREHRISAEDPAQSLRASQDDSPYIDFHSRLHAWYRQHGRHHLPWRNTDDPYPIWLSEVMLQQTQVQTVLERFYFPFLERFPSIESLAAAEEQEVLKCWQGLGYYTRARNLHKAARMIFNSRHSSESWNLLLHETPASAGVTADVTESLLTLPGIGRNTAHAVAAFAFRQPVAIMEANVKRILCRIFALENPSEAELWQRAAELLDAHNPFDYNQAMMDIGAMVCTPDTPQCLLCPAAEICAGKTNPKAYPAPKAKKQLPLRQYKIVLFTDAQGNISIAPRETKLLHGLWQFPEFPRDAEVAYFENIAHPFATMQKIGEVAHAYTHFQYHAEVYQQPVPHGDGIHPAEIEHLPLSRIEVKILKLLKATL